MRPLYQEVILPNLAYIGGWAEMSYWHQFKWAIDAMDVHFPLLVPRMSPLRPACATITTAIPERLIRKTHGSTYSPQSSASFSLMP